MSISLARTMLTLLAALLLAFGATACGSDDDGGGGTQAATAEQEPLSATDYLQQVNGAQTKFASDAAKLDLSSPESPQSFKKSLDRFVGLVDTLTASLDEIEPPESVADQHDELVTQMTKYGDTIRQEKGGLASDDQARVAESGTAIGTASTRFSKSFDATLKRINRQLEQ